MSYLEMAKRASVKLGLRQIHHEEKVLVADGEDPRRLLETVEPELRDDHLEADSPSDDFTEYSGQFGHPFRRKAATHSGQFGRGVGAKRRWSVRH